MAEDAAEAAAEELDWADAPESATSSTAPITNRPRAIATEQPAGIGELPLQKEPAQLWS